MSHFRLTLGAVLCAVSLVFGALYAVDSRNVSAVNIPTNLIISICDDGIINSGEACDDGPGNNTGGYASSTAERKCNPDCLSFGPYCGDDILQARFSEECDDGNNTAGDLCDASCKPEEPSPPGSGSPPRGPIPSSSAPQGSLPAANETRVVLRGYAYPNQDVNILLDGDAEGIVRADANAAFIYSTTEITPGTATFSFWATDRNNVDSITTSAVFEVVQGAVTTVANVFLPPSILLSGNQLAPGELLELSGQTVPGASVTTEISESPPLEYDSSVDTTGNWALQIDTQGLQEGFHVAKSLFALEESVKSGWGRALSFYVGDAPLSDVVSPDINGDGKINLVDFSIFLTLWNTDDIRGDFNQDGIINLADFSIMLFNWTG